MSFIRQESFCKQDIGQIKNHKNFSAAFVWSGERPRHSNSTFSALSLYATWRHNIIRLRFTGVL